MFEFIVSTLYLALPAFFANMAPPIAAKMNVLESLGNPVDGGRKIAGKEILGSHKTWRGFIVGAGAGTLIGILQFLLNQLQIANVEFFNSFLLSVAFGFLGGTGALIGDSAVSFAKRRLEIKSGSPFIPFDQIDYIIFFILFTSILFPWTFAQIIILLLFVLIANPLTNIIAYFLGIKKTYW